MKPKSLMLLFVAGACGLVAAFAVMQHLSATPALPPGPPPEARKFVVVAVDDYEVGTLLKPEMLKKVEVPEQGLPSGTFSDPAQLTGQTLRMQVYKDELVLEGKLGGDKGLAHLARNLPPGMTLATIHLKEEDARLTGLVNPGQNVDVIWSPNRPDLHQRGLSVITLLQDIKIGAVGQRTEADQSEPSSGRDSKSPDPNYTLLVTHEQYMRLAAAGKNGTIRLALRGKGGRSVEQLDEETLDILLGLKAPRVPLADPEQLHKPEPRGYEIEYVRDGQIVVETLNVSDSTPGNEKKRSSSKN